MGGCDASLLEVVDERQRDDRPRLEVAEVVLALGPLVFEMAGRPGYDPSLFAMAASEWGNRLALVATGAAPSAVSALAKLSGERVALWYWLLRKPLAGLRGWLGW